MKKRLTILALLMGALAFAFAAVSSMTTIGASAATTSSVSAGVLSPQRVPGLLADLTTDSAIRDTVAAATANQAGQNCVAVQRDGRTVSNVNASQPLIPASSLKLLTAAAAIDVYGADAKFTTAVKGGDIDGGVLNGPLYVVGGGDPLLFTDPYAKALDRTPDNHTSLETLVNIVVAKGIKEIKGSVIGDDSRFDQTRYLASWDPSLQAQGQIGPTGALQVNQGFERFAGGRVAADNPTLHAVAVFTDLLKQAGVKVDGDPASGIAPDKVSEFARVDSASVGQIVQEMLTESDNSTAEMMLRNIGVKVSDKGTFSAGIAGVKQSMDKLGVSLNGVTMVDGSGLDRNDRVTCSTLVAVLARDGQAGTIAAGLPQAGKTGTLTDRMTGTAAVGHVAAKTGTLAGVSALAGWVTPTNGTPFAFAVINNGIASDQARGFEDGLAVSLAGLSNSSNATAFAPSS